jgi:hypothetical protein
MVLVLSFLIARSTHSLLHGHFAMYVRDRTIQHRSVANRTFDSDRPPCYDRLDVCLTELFSAENPQNQVPWPK